MKITLGIDTGGTYTDAVLYDIENKKILASAKAPTTPENLMIGIRGSMAELPRELCRQAERASLSTTLATNACVEGKGAHCAMILMGYDPALYMRISREYGLPDTIRPYFIPGRHNMRGEEEELPDWNALYEILRELPSEIETFAVAEYGGIFHPGFEKEAAERIRSRTGKTVTSAHELSRQVNSLRRAATTCLNAQLIPLITRLIASMRGALDEMGLSVPLMIVRGDGTLMTEEFAREHPVETLLSGPAASVMGGIRLTGENNGLLVDMGGTTTDIALVEDGRTHVEETGVAIGNWRTGTRAVSVGTIGLGGDSLITVRQENIAVGPSRALPLCRLAEESPRCLEVLRKMAKEERVFTFSRAEFLKLVREPAGAVSAADSVIVEALREGPLSLEELAEKIRVRPYFLHTDALEKTGCVLRSALTPTDLLHASGEFVQWNVEASRLGIDLLAGTLMIEPYELTARVREMMSHRLFDTMACFLLKREVPESAPELPREWLNLAWSQRERPAGLFIKCPYPIAALGAPTHFFMGKAAEKLATRVLRPEYAHVANAVGAASGRIEAVETVWIRPKHTVAGVEGYACHGSESFAEFEDRDEAVAWAREEAVKTAERKAQDMGAEVVEIVCTVGDKTFTQRNGNGTMETWVTARAQSEA